MTPEDERALQAWYRQRPQDVYLRRQPLPTVPLDDAAAEMNMSREKVVELVESGVLEAEGYHGVVYVRVKRLSGAV